MHPWLARLILFATATLLFLPLSNAGFSSVKEHARALWWRNLERPAAAGLWETGFDRVTVPAGTDFGGFTVDIFYPVAAGSASHARFGSFAWSLLHPTSASVVPRAPVAVSNRPYPLIIYFPSWFSTARENSFTLANLARHGFMVAALDDVVHLPLDRNSERSAQQSALDTTSEAGFARTSILAGQRMDLEGRAGLTALDAVLASPRWGPLVDHDRIGALGFSFGGGAAVAMSQRDPRVKAVVNLDGSLFGNAAHFGVDEPYLVLFGGDVLPQADQLTSSNLPARFEAVMNQEEIARQHRDGAREGHWTYLIPKAQHLDFSDRLIFPAFNDRRRLSGFTRLEIWSALNRTLQAFFGDPKHRPGAPASKSDTDQGLLEPLCP